MSYRVNLLGDGGDGEKIGIDFMADSTTDVQAEDESVAVIELTPQDALELAAQLGDAYGLHKRWIDAREDDPETPAPEVKAPSGLTVENYRLKILLDAGYELETAEGLAKNEAVDLREAQRLAEDAGPKLAAEILR